MGAAKPAFYGIWLRFARAGGSRRGENPDCDVVVRRLHFCRARRYTMKAIRFIAHADPVIPEVGRLNRGWGTQVVCSTIKLEFHP
jgi:hypothetical protein